MVSILHRALSIKCVCNEVWLQVNRKFPALNSGHRTCMHLRLQQAMQEAVGSYFPWRLKKTPIHSNQQLVTPLENFWTKFLCDCKKLDANFFLLQYYTVLARSTLDNIWHFMYTSSNIHRNLPASVVKNGLQSEEYSIQAKILNAALQKYTCNTSEHRRNTFLISGATIRYMARSWTLLGEFGRVRSCSFCDKQSFCTTST